MENDDIAKQPVFKILMQEADQLEREFTEFRSEFSRLWSQDEEIIARIVKCHLTLEHYLTRYLEIANPSLGTLDEARLTFIQKLELATNPASVVAVIAPGIRYLNTLRNKIVHRLQVKIVENDLKPIQTFIEIKYRGLKKPIPTGIELIEDFTITACTFLAGSIKQIKEKSDGMGLIGLTKWWQERIQGLNEPKAGLV